MNTSPIQCQEKPLSSINAELLQLPDDSDSCSSKNSDSVKSMPYCGASQIKKVEEGDS